MYDRSRDDVFLYIRRQGLLCGKSSLKYAQVMVICICDEKYVYNIDNDKLHALI